MLTRSNHLRASKLNPLRLAQTSLVRRRARPYTTDNPVTLNEPNPKPPAKNVSETNAMPHSSTGAQDLALQENPEDAERMRDMQAPNRYNTWARSQRPRREAMVGPRFEQTIIETQPRPAAAIELIHKQPVRWTNKRQVSCDGGGGPLGHPRVFLNIDKPQICWCTYCGVPFVSSVMPFMLKNFKD